MLAVLVLSAGCVGPERRPLAYEVPQGYRGWVELEYGRPDCAPLGVQDDGAYVVRFDSQGQACTATEFEAGVAKDHWYYVGPHGREELQNLGVGQPDNWIWGGRITNMSCSRRIGTFKQAFVGSEEDFQARRLAECDRS